MILRPPRTKRSVTPYPCTTLFRSQVKVTLTPFSFPATDHAMMARALRLAERGAYTTRPNPMVGCVIARVDEVVGEGWHQRQGGPHAEVFALEQTGDRANGARSEEHTSEIQPLMRTSYAVLCSIKTQPSQSISL